MIFFIFMCVFVLILEDARVHTYLYIGLFLFTYLHTYFLQLFEKCTVYCSP